jgi:hypothetical protein
MPHIENLRLVPLKPLQDTTPTMPEPTPVPPPEPPLRFDKRTSLITLGAGLVYGAGELVNQAPELGAALIGIGVNPGLVYTITSALSLVAILLAAVTRSKSHD